MESARGAGEKAIRVVFPAEMCITRRASVEGCFLLREIRFNNAQWFQRKIQLTRIKPLSNGHKSVAEISIAKSNT